jgi:tetratricopeptide (TPR) repeat protein
MQQIDERYKKEFSDKLNAFYDNDRWQEAKELLEKEVKKYPKEYFLITSLAKTCYNLKLYEESLMYAIEAMKIEPNDVLVIYDYGCSLSALGRNSEAIKQWNKILVKDINEIAYGDFGEGLRWAKSIKNDARYRKAISSLEIGKKDEAAKLIKEHLLHRQRGIYSDFSKKQIVKKQKSIMK